MKKDFIKSIIVEYEMYENSNTQEAATKKAKQFLEHKKNSSEEKRRSEIAKAFDGKISELNEKKSNFSRTQYVGEYVAKCLSYIKINIIKKIYKFYYI